MAHHVCKLTESMNNLSPMHDDNAQAWAHELELQQQETIMAYQHKEGRGSGWTNHSDNPQAPKLKGSMCWKGEQINWALWKNPKKKDTDPDWGLKLEEPRDDAGASKSSYNQAPKPAPKLDDDFPF